jgi:hypothetical protein
LRSTRPTARGGAGGSSGEGIGGGVYNLGTFIFDQATVITGNHAPPVTTTSFRNVPFESKGAG